MQAATGARALGDEPVSIAADLVRLQLHLRSEASTSIDDVMKQTELAIADLAVSEDPRRSPVPGGCWSWRTASVVATRPPVMRMRWPSSTRAAPATGSSRNGSIRPPHRSPYPVRRPRAMGSSAARSCYGWRRAIGVPRA
jgi:hypothetical protein